MLIYFRDFCNKYGLMFYLTGGGAIGAVREHGFIPWDDDIDCLMPQPDYDRFPELWEKHGDKERYVFCRTDENVNYHHSSSSLRDPNTTFICSYNQNQDICHGIALEFGPIVAAPDSRFLQAVQTFDGMLFSLFNFQRLPNNRGRFLRICTKIVYALVPSKKMKDRIWQYAERRVTKYSWERCKYVRQIWDKTTFILFPKEWFTSQVWFDFEGEKVPLMAGYKGYLKFCFGDYMQRPPVEEQVAKHELAFVDMDHPYTDYAGIYYFPDKDPRNTKKKKVSKE